MFAAYPGDLVFSKIDVRNGAIGLVPQAIAKAVITPEFPVLMPHPDKIDGRYLELILQAGGFVAALRRKASGTSGRKRITPAIFLDLAIPLPPLAAQQTLVAAHRAALARAAADEAKAEALELQAVADFADALGLAPSAPLPDNPVFIAKFRDLDRWSHEAVLRRSIGGEAHEAAWPTVRLGDVISDLQNGWSPKCYDRPAEGDEWGVLKLGAVSFGVFDERQNKGLPKGFAPRPSLEVKPGQVLISRANITRLVGATALVGEVRPRLLLCDKIFRCVFLEDSVIDPAFVAEVLRIGSVREQIEAGVTGTSPTMKNISKPALLALAFPLPPLDVQRSLVAALVQARTSATTLRIAASISRSEARVAFEAAVYS